MSILSKVPRLSIDRESKPYSPATTYYMILISAVLLGGFGLLMTFSATAVSNIAAEQNPYLSFVRSFLIIAGSALIAAVAAIMPGELWKKLAPLIFVTSVLLQLAVIPFGLEGGGNQNWLPIPGTNQVFQPSEFLKLGTCLFLAMVLSNLGTAVTEWKRVLLAAGLPSVIAIGAVMTGHDMGTALIFVAIALGALWIAGIPGKWYGPIILFVFSGAAALVAIMPSRITRIRDAIPGMKADPNPSAPTQSDHGLWALGSGGLLGVGPGASREKWNYLQEADTDFILAIVGEEFGLLGSLTLLIALGVLVWGTLRLASHSKTAFVRIASGSVACWLIFQGIVNIGTVTGLLPVIGVPFPLVSHGGSAYLFTALSIGILLSFARTDAGMKWRTKLDPETGGRDPREVPARRKVKKNDKRRGARGETENRTSRRGNSRTRKPNAGGSGRTR